MSIAVAVIGTVAAYVLLAVLLLSLNIASLWHWWLKGAAIVLTSITFAGSFFAITGLIGWPAPQEMPQRFSLLASKVVEPDKASGAKGNIYIWAEEVDEDNLPIAAPRAYEVVYTIKLAEALSLAAARLANGEQVLGEMLQETGEEAEAEANGEGQGNANGEGDDDPDREGDGQMMGAPNRQAASGVLTGVDISDRLRLSVMPPAALPEKPM